MKCIIQKGFRGFGDRLEHLIWCVKYAILTKSKVYVDWTDFYWNHSGEDFYKYFDLENIGIDRIENSENLKIVPSFWKNKLDRPMDLEIYDIKPAIFVYNHLDLLLKKLDTNWDILVMASQKRIVEDKISYFGDIFRVKDKRIIHAIQNLNIKYNLPKCLGIHLRGTDRKEKLSNTQTLNNLPQIKESEYDNIVCFTDDLDLFKLFQSRHPNAKLLTKYIIDEPNSGTHKITPEKLKFSKDAMNIDLLTDFFALASCKESYTTFKNSTFHRTAARLRPYVNSILGNGYMVL
jgi:hypothetical protein